MSFQDEMEKLATQYAGNLKAKIEKRVEEMKHDDDSHFLIYRMLGVTHEEGKLIDVYQNKGRFLYKYAGSFLEEATQLCFKRKFLDAGSIKIPNTLGMRPKTFEIDCVVNSDAIEIKWRDATTDGDHITKNTHGSKSSQRQDISRFGSCSFILTASKQCVFRNLLKLYIMALEGNITMAMVRGFMSNRELKLIYVGNLNK